MVCTSDFLLSDMAEPRSTATVSGDGSITIRDLPFREGEEVDVVVVPHRSLEETSTERSPLRGSVRRYDRPFEPATDASDWEAR